MAGRLPASEIHEGVRRIFNRVAETPTAAFRFGVGAALAREVGYLESVVAGVPPAVTESFTGLADLHPYLALQPGEHVLDLGSGAGFDAIVATRAVAPGGTVTGLDMAEAMVAKARQAAALLGVEHVGFERGEAEATPFDDATFDAALVNGIFNLCPDKPPVARDLHRVLRPGGRAVVAEITFTEPLAPTEVQSIDDWFR
jgi:SAM-dependent methyltransferase